MPSVNETIGRQVARSREAAGLTQAELARRLAAYLGSAWPRQRVSVAEAGKRPWLAVEVLAVGEILGVSPMLLLSAVAEYPSGAKVAHGGLRLADNRAAALAPILRRLERTTAQALTEILGELAHARAALGED